MNISELKEYFYKGKAKPFAWPGGYPLFYVTTDGAALCPTCVTKERAQIFRSTHERSHDGWAIAGVDANYEDINLYCDHCGKSIDPAYLSEDELEAAREAQTDYGL